MIATQDNYNASQDMSSLGAETTKEVDRLLENVLSNHSNEVYGILKDGVCPQIDFVLDNAGFELFTDLCFGEFLVHFGFAKRIIFHCKQLPWFVSDASVVDLMWLVGQLSCHANADLSRLGKTWKSRISEGTWKVVDHPFWTLPHEYAKMKDIAPDLYEKLSKSSRVLQGGPQLSETGFRQELALHRSFFRGTGGIPPHQSVCTAHLEGGPSGGSPFWCGQDSCLKGQGLAGVWTVWGCPMLPFLIGMEL